ncbi:MAG: protein phosphatase 2C domain-containing protein [Acidimicrobiales bacterium]
MTVLRSGSATNVGSVRSVNEDRSLETVSLFAVADGMGGHVGGEVAASIAIETLEAGFARSSTLDGLVAAIQAANSAVWERGADDPDLRGMGTTVVATALVATADGDRLIVANVGDSRAYRFSANALSQLSVDHSVAEELLARGELSEAEAAVHPHRHILTRVLGIVADVEVDVWEVVPLEGDRYLLCSDGLSNDVADDVMAGVLSSVRDPQAAADTLVALALEAGGSDNITAVVVDVLVGETAAGADEAGTEVPSDLTGAVPVVGAEPGSGVVRSGAEVGPSETAGADQAPKGRKRKGPRRITFRVLLFLILLGGLAYGAWYVIKVYVGDSYYVGLQKNELVIFQGRPGGFLGMEPTIVDHTGVKTAQVGSIVLPALRAGVQEPTRTAATRYVTRLVTAECSLVNPPPTCPPTTTTTTLPVPTTTAGGL